MALSFKSGRAIAQIVSGKHKDEIIYINTDEDPKGPVYQKIDLKNNKLSPILDPEAWNVSYITGPSGSGKSTYAAKLLESYKKNHKKSEIYYFSRTPVVDDPAYAKIKPIQVRIDQSLVDDPILVEDIERNSMTVFDDISSIHSKTELKEVEHIVIDLLETGRKYKRNVILTNHLINPNNKSFGRTVLNELHSLTFFGKSGASYQINYTLKNYFGLSNKQIDEILKLPSRWVTIFKTFPMVVLYEHGAYVL